MPPAELVQVLAIEQRVLRGGRPVEGVATSPAVDHANLKKHTAVAIRAGRGILFQMEPSLFGIPSIRAEDSFPGECPGAGERVDIDEKAITARGVAAARLQIKITASLTNLMWRVQTNIVCYR